MEQALVAPGHLPGARSLVGAAPFRFAYFFLESVFRRVRDDGFSSEKALIVLGCSEIAAAFTVANGLSLGGVRWSRLEFGAPVAMAIGLLVMALNYVAVFGGDGHHAHQQAYNKMPARIRALGGVVVVIFVITAVVACIVTGTMVASLSSA